ncbi:MAG: hypothetical protein J0H08_13140 [Rhizobiales bacterium]|nr:hypothetical protein [Hyphomicrobiales bacterium]
MQIAFHRLNEAMEDKTVYDLPPGAVAVEGPDALYFIDAARGDVLRFDGSGAPAVVYDGPEDVSPIRAIRVLDDDKGMVIVREDGTVLRAGAPGSEPKEAGRVTLMPAGALEPYDRDAELAIERDGVVIVRHYEGDPSLQILDTATGHGLAGGDEAYGSEYIVLPEGRSFLMNGLAVKELVDTGEALALVPIEASEEDAQWLLLQGCFLDAGSTPPEQLPEIDVVASSGSYDHSCKATPDGVIHTFYSSGSGGVGRYDEIIRPDEAPVNLAQVIGEISTYDLRHNFAWVGYEPTIQAYTVLVNRDLLVFDQYQMDLIRKHPVEVGPARLLGNGRIAIVEAAANRVTVRDISPGELRPALSRADEASVAAGNETIAPLNRGTCVGYALSGLAYEHTLADGTTLVLDGSTLTSGQGPPRVTIGGTAVAVGDDEACLQFSPDLKRVATIPFDTPGRLIDFERLRAGASLEEATVGVLPQGTVSAFPIGDGNTVLVSGGDGAVRLIEPDGKGGWSEREIYRGDYPVIYAEPDAEARRLLIIESTGSGDTRGFLYSVDAGERWLELGTDYKWFGEAFAADGGIASGAGRIVRFVDLPPLSALVAETRGRLAGGEG